MKQLLGTEHLVTLAVIAICTAALTTAVRVRTGRWEFVAARTLAVVLVVNELSWPATLIASHNWSVQGGLPLAICDSASFIAAAALWTRHPLLVELTWFWGIAGATQAILTPDTGNWHFPDYNYIQYYVAHGAIVMAAVYLVVGLGLRPRAGAVRRVMALTLAYAAAVGAIDLAVNGNYMYLRQKPGAVSLLDLFGPWPLYLIVATGLAVVLFTLLDLPFWKSRGKSPSMTAHV